MNIENEKLKEFNEYIRFRKVAVIGLGVSNLPLLDYLYEKKAQVTVFDEKTMEEIPKDIIDKISKYNFQFSFFQNLISVFSIFLVSYLYQILLIFYYKNLNKKT